MIDFASYSWYWVSGSLGLIFSACSAFDEDFGDDWSCIFALLLIFIGCLPIIIVIYTPLGLDIPMCTWGKVVLTVGLLAIPAFFQNNGPTIVLPITFASALLIIYGLWKMEDPGALCITTISEGNAPLVRMHKELRSKIAEDAAEVAKADEEMEQLSSGSARAMIKARRDEIHQRLVHNMELRHRAEDLALRIYATRCLEAAGVDVTKDDIQKEAESIMKEILQ